MTLIEAMDARHSVRSYLDKKIEPEKVKALQEAVEQANRESGLHIQLYTEEDASALFPGCRNHISMAGPAQMDEAAGYYGERLVLIAQTLGLNTCWVGLPNKRTKVPTDLKDGEKLYVVIALGYGATAGSAHRSKPASAVSNLGSASPEWFRRGVEAALNAPTAICQQQFHLSQNGDAVTAKAKPGFFAKLDLGIVKLHFELGAGKENFRWTETR